MPMCFGTLCITYVYNIQSHGGPNKVSNSFHQKLKQVFWQKNKTKLEFSLLFSCVSNFLFCRTLTFLILYRTFLLQYKKVCGGRWALSFLMHYFFNFFFFFINTEKFFPFISTKNNETWFKFSVSGLCVCVGRLEGSGSLRTRARARTQIHTPQINGRHGREKGVASVAIVTGGQRCWILLPGRRGSLPPSERRQTGVVRPGR